MSGNLTGSYPVITHYVILFSYITLSTRSFKIPRQIFATLIRRRRTALSKSRFCPDFPENPVRWLSAVWILSGFSVKCLSVRILSVSILSAVRVLSGFLKKLCPLSLCPTRTRQSCPDFRCPCPPSSDSNVKRYEFALLRSGY